MDFCPNFIPKKCEELGSNNENPIFKELRAINDFTNLIYKYSSQNECEDYSEFDYIISRANEGNFIKSLNFESNIVTFKDFRFEDRIRFPLICSLPGGLLFVGAGELVYPEFSKKYYILNPETSEIIDKTEDIERDYDSGCIFYQSEIYIFGGKIRKIPFIESAKYNIIKKQWTKLQNLPMPSSISCPILNGNNIWLIGYYLDSILSYSPKNDSYTKMPYAFEGNFYKSLLQHNERIFALVADQIWEIVCKTGKAISIGRLALVKPTYRFVVYKKYIYLFDGLNILRLNVSSMSVDIIVDMTYSDSMNS